MTILTPVVLETSVIQEIYRIGQLRLPNEACGVVIPAPYKGKQVWELPNRSHMPKDSFAMASSDILMELKSWAEDNPEDGVWENLTIWHTHPTGGTAPSKADLDNRIELCGNLLVALTDEGPKATWF